MGHIGDDLLLESRRLFRPEIERLDLGRLGAYDRRAGGDLLLELRGVDCQPRARLGDLALEPHAFEYALDGEAETRTRIGGLRDVVGGACAQGLDRCRDVVLARHHDDRRVDASPKLAKNVEAGDAGKVVVEEQEVETPGVEVRARLRPLAHADELDGPGRRG